MITKATAANIYNAHYEIEKSEKLLDDLQKAMNKSGELKLSDAFGNKNGLTLGVPTSSSSHSLYDVSESIAIAVIKQNIEDKKKRLDELMLIAADELNKA